MNRNFSLNLAKIVLTLSLEVGAIASLPTIAKAQLFAPLLNQKSNNIGEAIGTKIRFKPPKVGVPENLEGGAARLRENWSGSPASEVGAPGNREGGATRGGIRCSQGEKRLQALIPESNIGLTTAEYPTFFVFVPQTNTQSAEFVLLDATTEDMVYKTRFALPPTAGIISFSLPSDSNLPPLEIGKKYHWFFSINCDLEDPSADIFVEGWVQRILPEQVLVNQLKQATPRDRPSLYAEAGIWHETIANLARLRFSRPQDTSLVTDWKELLKSVGLSHLAEEPIARCFNDAPVRQSSDNSVPTKGCQSW